MRPVLVQPGAGSPAAAPDAPAAAVAPGVVRARADQSRDCSGDRSPSEARAVGSVGHSAPHGLPGPAVFPI